MLIECLSIKPLFAIRINVGFLAALQAGISAVFTVGLHQTGIREKGPTLGRKDTTSSDVHISTMQKSYCYFSCLGKYIGAEIK